MEKYIQVLGEMTEEFYKVTDNISNDDFQSLYEEWNNQTNEEDFEDWLKENHGYEGVEQIFVEEIYV
jgi:predicted acetyltransferase